ncbi:MAG: SDR family oxidoreductase [Anaerolineales bacterium]
MPLPVGWFRGAKIAVLDLNEDAAKATATELPAAIGLRCDVLDRASIQAAAEAILARYGRVDSLINGAGGNHPSATVTPEQAFFDLPAEAAQFVFNLNFLGSFLPAQVFGAQMAAQGHGSILNISSMTALRPLTRVVAYGAAKAAINNFTAWLAVHLASEYDPRLRVNAIAPGFFITEQNRYLLTDAETGGLSPRGQQVVDHTPMGRFGEPDDLLGTVQWLLSDAARFVTGVVVPIDGGFSAYSGV